MKTPAAISCALVASGVAPAQSTVPERVEQGVEDVGPLGVGRVDLRADLRLGIGWEDVYQIRKGDPARGIPPLFGRRNGALTAVFPYSVYLEMPEGIMPLIPPGTVFHFGDVPAGEEPAERPRSENFIDTTMPASRIDLAADASAPAAPAIEPPAMPTMWTSETYRRHRLRTLIDAALRVELAEGGSG